MDAKTITYLIVLFAMAAMYHWLLRQQTKRYAQMREVLDELTEDNRDFQRKLEDVRVNLSSSYETNRRLGRENSTLQRQVNDLTTQLQLKQ